MGELAGTTQGITTFIVALVSNWYWIHSELCRGGRSSDAGVRVLLSPIVLTASPASFMPAQANCGPAG